MGRDVLMFLERLQPFYLGVTQFVDQRGAYIDMVVRITAQIHPPRRSIPLPAPLSETFSPFRLLFFSFLLLFLINFFLDIPNTANRII